ncbi:MAG: hypothetical protein ACFFDN_23025 [Candidatus Hodarchaeota archaeon]
METTWAWEPLGWSKVVGAVLPAFNYLAIIIAFLSSEQHVMFIYIFKNWKLIIHLLFRTYRFGVNNERWSPFPSIFRLPWSQRWHLILRYKEMRFRACECFFISEPWKLFPLYWRKHHKT